MAGYLIIDVNQRELIECKGEHDQCVQQAIRDEFLVMNEEANDVSNDSSLIQPTEALIGFKCLHEFEEAFFRRQYLIL